MAPPRARPDLEALARPYALRQVSLLLSVAVACLLSVESEGLLTWARRLQVGPLQTAAVFAASRVHGLFSTVGLTRPRAFAIALGEGLARTLGAQADPVLASGWRKDTGSPPPAGEQEPIEAPREARVAVPGGQAAPAESSSEIEPLSTTVLLLGDSMMAGSLGSAIAQSLGREPKPRLVRAVQTATGLSRPDVFDWMTVLPPLLERDKPRLVICSLGANDASDMWQVNGVLEFGRPGWRSAYTARVKAMMQALTAGGARVLWLGLPPMRVFSDRARSLNKIFAQAASGVPGVEYLDVEMLVSRNGEYATFLKNPDGRFVRVRMEDGVHYAPAGGKLISRWLVDWIYERRAGLGMPR